MLSNIFVSRLTPYVEEITGDHQCRFRRDKSTTDQILCIRKILEKRWKLFMDIQKACDSVRREVIYNILTEFGILMKSG